MNGVLFFCETATDEQKNLELEILVSRNGFNAAFNIRPGKEIKVCVCRMEMVVKILKLCRLGLSDFVCNFTKRVIRIHMHAWTA